MKIGEKMGGKFNRKIGGKSQLKNRWTKTVEKNGINIGEKFSGKIGGKMVEKSV